MKFKGYLSKLWVIAIIVINLVMFSLLFVAESASWQFMCLPVIVLMDLYMIPVIALNYLIIDKQNIIIYFGLLKTVIPIKMITKIVKTKTYKASFATSTNRLGIEGYGKDTIYISLQDNDKFVKELMRRNKQIKYVIGE